MVASAALGLVPIAASADVRVAVLSHLAHGQKVRLTTSDGAAIEGHFVALRDGQVVLDWPPRAVPIESVEAIWRRDRSTRAGAVGAGLTFGVLLGTVGFMATLFCLAGSEDCGSAEILGFAGIALGGGATGAGLGGVVGATLPRWRLVFPLPMHGDRPREERVPPRSSGRSLSAPPLLGSLSLHLGHGDEAGRAARGGSGVRLRLSAELGSGVASCLELERFDVGPRESMHQLGVAVTRMRTYGRVRPYGLVGLGRYVWQTPDPDTVTLGGGQDSFGGSVGAGLRVHAGGPLWLGAEGRWHTTFSRLPPLTSEGPARRRNLWSFTTGTSLSW